MEMSDLERRELRAGLARDLEALVRDEAAGEQPLVPDRFEISFGGERSTTPRARARRRAHRSRGRSTASTSSRSRRAAIVQDYKAGKTAHSARDIEKELRLQIPLYMLVLRDLIGLEPLGGVYRPLSGDRRARGLLRADAGDDLPGFVTNDYLDDDAFWAQVEGARETARDARRPDQDRRRAPRPEGRRVPRRGASSGRCAGWRTREGDGESRADRRRSRRAAASSSPRARAPARRPCSSSASSRAVCDEGLDVDSLLVITYTKRAAGELRSRIRQELRGRGRHDLAPRARRRLDLDHPRLLQPAAEGVPVRGRARPALPRARRGAGAGAARRGLRRGAERVLRRGRPAPAAAARDLRRAGAAAHADGHPRDAALGRPAARARARASGSRSTSALEALREAARCLATTPTRPTCTVRTRRACSRSSAASPSAEQLLDLSPHRCKGAARGELRGGAQAGRAGGARRRWRTRDRDLLQALLDGFAAQYAAAKRRESALDFEDLQLAARDLLLAGPRSSSASSCASAASRSTSSRTRTASSAS